MQDTRNPSDVVDIFDEAFEYAPIGMLLIRPDGSYIRGNRLFATLTGLRYEQWLSEPRGSHTHPDDRPSIQSAIARLRDQASEIETFPVRILNAEGGYSPFEATLRAVRNPAGTLRVIIGHLVDLSSLQRIEAELTERSSRDPLTKVLRLSAGQAYLERSLRGDVDDGHRVGVVVATIDDLNEFGTRFGPAAGNAILAGVAQSLLRAVGDDEVVARIGPDGFVVVASAVAGEAGTAHLLDRIGAAIGEPVRVAGQPRRITASIGVAMATTPQAPPNPEGPSDAGDAGDLLQDAVDAVSLVQERGGNAVVVASSQTRATARERRQVAQRLRKALDDGEFVAHYQPVVDLKTNHMTAAESLMRWIRPEGSVSPGLFIPLAEESGDIVDIGSWMAVQVARDVASWRAPALAGILVHLNVSAVQFRDTGLAAKLLDEWERQGLDPGRLVIELTETKRLASTDEARRIIGQLHDAGVKFAIDDFGAGQAWFGTLGDLEPDILKLDMIFARQIASQEPGALAVAGALVACGRAMGAEVIAEGVSTSELAEAFLGVDCHSAQGWYYAAALASADLERYAAR